MNKKEVKNNGCKNNNDNAKYSNNNNNTSIKFNPNYSNNNNNTSIKSNNDLNIINISYLKSGIFFSKNNKGL